MSQVQRPRAGSLLAQAYSIASGTALGQLALIAITPVLTRIYSAESFGAFGIFTAFITVAALFVTFRLDMAIPQANTDADADRLLRITLAIVGPASLSCAPLVLAMDFGDAVQGWPAHAALVSLTAAATAAAAWFSALRYWHVRRMGFSQIGRGVATQGIVRAFSPAALALAFPSWFGLGLGDTIGRMFGIFSLGRTARRAMKENRAEDSRSLREFLRGFRRYPLLLMPSSVVDAIASNIAIPIIAKLFGVGAAGEYALIMRVAAAPAALVGVSIGDVFHARLADSLRSAPHEARSQLWHAAKRLAALGLVIYLPLAISAPLLFAWVFGREWSHAGTIFTILTPYLLSGFIVSPLSRALLATNRMELKLIVDALFLVVPPTCLLLTSGYGFETALAVFACVQVLIFACYAALIVRAVASPRS